MERTMALVKLLDLAREIMTAIIETAPTWLTEEYGNGYNDNDELMTLEENLQAEIDGYQGHGFLSNWVTDAILDDRFGQTVSNLDEDDQEELETMIRDLAVDYLATGKVM